MKAFVRCMMLAISCGCCLGVSRQVDAGMALLTDDGYAANDPNRGPGVGGDRSDFFEIRHHTTAPRKKIGYLKYDISSIDPGVYSSAVLSGVFQSASHDNAGTWNVYGLTDGADNTDDVADGSFGEANWTEAGLSYSKGLGVDTAISTTDSSLGIDLAEVTLLGTIAIPGNAPFQSNPSSLPLGSFLAADTNGKVTFLLTDANAAGTEWRVMVSENAAGGNQGVALSFVPEPTSIVMGLLGLGLTWGGMRRRSRPY